VSVRVLVVLLGLLLTAPPVAAEMTLGYALRNQGKYPESIKAHDEALEYLGEAYPSMAQELSETIAKGK